MRIVAKTNLTNASLFAAKPALWDDARLIRRIGLVFEFDFQDSRRPPNRGFARQQGEQYGYPRSQP
jgi:hypothetical protein